MQGEFSFVSYHRYSLRTTAIFIPQSSIRNTAHTIEVVYETIDSARRTVSVILSARSSHFGKHSNASTIGFATETGHCIHHHPSVCHYMSASDPRVYSLFKRFMGVYGPGRSLRVIWLTSNHPEPSVSDAKQPSPGQDLLRFLD